ncbi:MAG: polymorphic toxin type 10 domain-containing protein [Pseudomonadota bacterium]
MASPVFRTNPGFQGFGRTLGGARECVTPQGSVPAKAIIEVIK